MQKVSDGSPDDATATPHLLHREGNQTIVLGGATRAAGEGPRLRGSTAPASRRHAGDKTTPRVCEEYQEPAALRRSPERTRTTSAVRRTVSARALCIGPHFSTGALLRMDPSDASARAAAAAPLLRRGVRRSLRRARRQPGSTRESSP